jgi:hypothetical protein
MALTHEDLITMSKVDLETKKIDYGNRLISVDSESILRLTEGEYCDKKGNLTEKGLALCEQIQEKEKVLRRGVPLEDRKRADPLKVAYSEGKWLTGTYRDKKYLCDGYYFLYGSAYASMKAKLGSGQFRKYIPTMLSKVLSMKDAVEVIPKIWQLQTIGGLEIIWLFSEDGKMRVPIHAMYYDFTIKKYPSAKFCALSKPGTPIQVRVKQRGVPQDVVGIIMPMDLDPAIQQPIMNMEIINDGEETTVQ